METELANKTKTVNDLEALVDRRNKKVDDLKAKFEDLMKTKNETEKGLKFHKEQSRLKTKLIEGCQNRVNELEQKIAEDNKQKASTSNNEEIKRIGYK